MTTQELSGRWVDLALDGDTGADDALLALVDAWWVECEEEMAVLEVVTKAEVDNG